MRRILQTALSGDGYHWVGDGFYVTQLLPGSQSLQKRADPFLLMDYNPVREYPPTDRPRGVGAHPHRGFETVTIAFEGAVAHHDSTGGGGVIWPGDAQWMTAGRGILHKEYHEESWAAKGGRFHMLQLWVNLPAEHKMTEPGYQHITAESTGKVKLEGGGTVTLYAGELDGERGPASTYTPIELWDVQLAAAETAELAVPDGHTIMVFSMDGAVETDGGTIDHEQLGIFAREGDELRLTAGEAGGRVIVLGGKPIEEDVIFYGPFAMNTPEEIAQAVSDFNAGTFGALA